MTYPIRGADGAIRGVIYLDLDLGWLNEQAAALSLPEGAVFAIVDAAGTIVARAPEAEGAVGQAFPESPVFSEILEKKSGTEEITGEGGTTRLYGFTPIDQPVSTGLIALVGIPKSTAFASVNEDLTQNILVISVVGVLVLIAAWVGSEFFIIRQTRQLVTATRLVSGGDLAARSGIGSASGEFAALGNAFDEMAATLEQRAAEQKRTEEELRRLNESLEERVEQRTQEVHEHAAQLARSNAELEDFTYVVSHDLKEPLRGIEAFTGFLAEDYGDRLDDEGRRYLGVVRESSVRMKDLIEDLLELSRVGREQAHYEATDVGALVREALVDLRYAAAEKGVQVTEPATYPTLSCDRLRMKEVFKNLLSNAIKFSDKPRPNVEIKWESRGDEYWFCVADDGIGIDPQYHDKVFQIFQRIERREDYPGTGAGLTICKKIIESHGGRIGVESTRGDGCRFWFTLPLTASRR
jgi:signal transduction histidine kinase